MYDNSSVIGNIGETMALAEFVKRGVTVLIPFGQNVPYDLAIQINEKIYRVQCKTTKNIKKGNVMEFNICRTNGFTGEHKSYNAMEIDFFFMYCVENNYMALVPIHEVNAKRQFTIRINTPKNNQTNKIHMANDYLLDNQLELLSSA